MKKQKIKHFTVFEHQTLKVGINGLTKDQLESLVKYSGEGIPYYTPVYNGVKFNEYVGVIQIDGIIIEVLPKADKISGTKNSWRTLLIGMLRTVGIVNAHAPTSSSLCLKNNSVLEFYFEMFIKETEYLVHRGLVKKYRKKEGNSLALKGSLIFGKHIQKNLVHQERFYVRHTTYDKEHLLHQILYETLLVLKNINNHTELNSRICNLLLSFPEQKRLKTTESTFNKIVYNRKTEVYKNAIDIARLILLNYHPDLSRGHNDVLALMFDMNALWEKFIYVTLRGKLKNFKVRDQVKKRFWKRKYKSSSLIPDIVLEGALNNNIVLDTKWKNLYGQNPSPDDLRQLFAYSHYFDARRVALVYPGDDQIIVGTYTEPINLRNTSNLKRECGIIQISTKDKSGNQLDLKSWQKNIIKQISEYINIEE